MFVCLGGRKGKKDVHAKQLTYLKKKGGGFDTKQTSFKQKQQPLLQNQQTLMQNKQSQMQNQPFALNKRYRIPILVWFEEGKCTLSASGPKSCWQDPAHSSTNF